jgi:LmbE family N-acetylglucosaminyl deacetylase
MKGGAMNPYQQLAADFARLKQEGRSFPLGGLPPAPRPAIPANSPKVLIFSPHPDDECIIGGLALRLMREARWNVMNIAVTQGSNKGRQPGRWQELVAACDYLGFNLVATGPAGLEKVNVQCRTQDPAHWAGSVKVISGLLQVHAPRVILFPHELDWNSSHIGTYHLVMDALKAMPDTFDCHLVETEFWGQMASPNLMIELSSQDLGDLIAALTFHVGEVRRNPYHLLLSAWMMDNVRLGGELVGGQGGAPPDFTFATLYRLRRWRQGRIEPAYEGGRNLPAGTPADSLFK